VERVKFTSITSHHTTFHRSKHIFNFYYSSSFHSSHSHTFSHTSLFNPSHLLSQKKYSLITSPPLFTHSNTCMQLSLFILSGFSTAGSKFVSVVCQAGMVSTGDNGIRLVRASEE
jgi:hypothetical protein